MHQSSDMNVSIKLYAVETFFKYINITLDCVLKDQGQPNLFFYISYQFGRNVRVYWKKMHWTFLLNLLFQRGSASANALNRFSHEIVYFPVRGLSENIHSAHFQLLAAYMARSMHKYSSLLLLCAAALQDVSALGSPQIPVLCSP